MSNPNKRKGRRVEREICKALERVGIDAKLQPLSGQLGGSWSGDLMIEREWKAEVKARANGEGFAVLEGWLGNNRFLFLKRDRRDPFVAMGFDAFCDLVLRCKSGNNPALREEE